MAVTGHKSSASVNRYVKKTEEAARAAQAKRKTQTSPFRAPQGPGGYFLNEASPVLSNPKEIVSQQTVYMSYTFNVSVDRGS